MIMNAILLMMILGMTFIAVLLQPYIENLLVKFWLNFFCKRDSKLKNFVIMNLNSHEKRNTKTSIVFTICLSFVIFAGSSFKLIGKLVLS